MAVAKKPVKAFVKPKKQAEVEPPFVEEDEIEEEEEEELEPDMRPKGARVTHVQPPREKMSGFPQGSLFEGDRNSAVLFAGTFNPEELHVLIDEAAQNSTDPEKIRIKIFDVDEKYQQGPQHRVRINFAGLQPRHSGGNEYGKQKSWGRGSKRW